MIKPDSVKLVYCYFGNGIALGAYGLEQDICDSLNRLYNFKAHNDEITFLSEGFGYILTSKEQLARGLSNSYLEDLLGDKYYAPKAERDGEWKKAREKADIQASNVIEAMSHEPFLMQSSPAPEYNIPFDI